MLQELDVLTTGDKNVLEWVRQRKQIGEYRHQLTQEGPEPPKPGELSFFEFAEKEASSARAEISKSLEKAGKQYNNVWNLIDGELIKSDGPEKVYILSEIVRELSENTLEYNADKYKFLAEIVKKFPVCLDLPREVDEDSVYEKFVKSVAWDVETAGNVVNKDLEDVVKFIAEKEKLEKKSEWEFKGAELKGYRVFKELGAESIKVGIEELAEKLGIEDFEKINVKNLENAEPAINMSEAYASLRYLARLSKISGTRQVFVGYVLGGLKWISERNIETMESAKRVRNGEVIYGTVVSSVRELGIRTMMELLDLSKVSFAEVLDGTVNPTEAGLSVAVLDEMRRIRNSRGVDNWGGFVPDTNSQLAKEIGAQHLATLQKRK
jgi:hypothetical protein